MAHLVFCLLLVVLVGMACMGDDETPIQASESYEGDCIDSHDEEDSLFLQASLQYESGQSSSCESQSYESTSSQRFSTPVSGDEVLMVREEGIATKTKKSTDWCERIWKDWVRHRCSNLLESEVGSGYILKEDLDKMSVEEMNYWLMRFVLEVRRQDGKDYPPNSLYQICCGLMRILKFRNRANVNFFNDAVFEEFRGTLDSKMKTLQASGQFQTRKADIITLQMEDELWKRGLLGDHLAQVLLDTMVYYIGICFALRGGEDHRRLRHDPSQLILVEPIDGVAYLKYVPDVSKTNQGGLKHRKVPQEETIHYANTSNPTRCLIRLYKLYNSKCPVDRPAGAFYLKPLKNPGEAVWYQKVPVGHNVLSNTVGRLCKAAGFNGHYTNHSLRATTATRLFESGIDEQLIMQRTRHRSTDAVRSYKRVTENLKEVTSSVLNRCEPIQEQKSIDEVSCCADKEVLCRDKEKDTDKVMPSQPSCDDKKSAPVFNITGTVHFTLNF